MYIINWSFADIKENFISYLAGFPKMINFQVKKAMAKSNNYRRKKFLKIYTVWKSLHGQVSGIHSEKLTSENG